MKLRELKERMNIVGPDSDRVWMVLVIYQDSAVCKLVCPAQIDGAISVQVIFSKVTLTNFKEYVA